VNLIPLDKLKQDAHKQLAPVFGIRESKALLRALEEDLWDTPKTLLDGDDLTVWTGAIQRLLQHEPVAYITGKAYFLHLVLKVNPRVLIPRPETETLVIEAIRQLKPIHSPRVLDIGTGSGCIALAIRSAFRECKVYGLDIDPLVLDVARENAQEHRLDVEWLLADVLEEQSWNNLPDALDMIISNPPYILESEKKYMSVSTLNYEPPQALFSVDDPVRFYKVIAAFGLSHLKSGGRVIVEINEFMVEATMAVMAIPGYSQPELIQDLSGKDRIISMVKL